MINTESKIAQLPFIAPSISLKEYTWFKTGGPARFFAQPTNAYEFAQALEFADSLKLDIFVLGEGANILVSDDGFDGLVIRPQLQQIEIFKSEVSDRGCCNHAIAPANTQHLHYLEQHANNVLVIAQAGVSLARLITWCLERNIIGLEEFSGIPGTVGGSVFINLHYFEYLLEQFLVSAHVIDKRTGIIQEVDRGWFNFGYNQSTLQQGNHYLIDATFALKQVGDIETAYAKGRSIEIIRHRSRRYPPKNTCGSFFRNFYEHEVSLEDNNKKMIFVAYYLDKIGVKGNLHIGDAKVSYQHANMIVNQGNATSADIINVARKMQDLVFEKYGIIPQAECRFVGFKEYPLRKE